MLRFGRGILKARSQVVLSLSSRVVWRQAPSTFFFSFRLFRILSPHCDKNISHHPLRAVICLLCKYSTTEGSGPLVYRRCWYFHSNILDSLTAWLARVQLNPVFLFPPSQAMSISTIFSENIKFYGSLFLGTSLQSPNNFR